MTELITLARPAPASTNGTAPTSIIEMRGVVRRYKMGSATVAAVDGIDLGVARGEFIALMGASGSGKSTLLNLLGGLDQPTAGTIVVAGLDLAQAGRSALVEHRRRHVGFVFQSFNLLPHRTALENVEVPLMLCGQPGPARRARARALLEQMGLSGRADHRPSELSGGEQQRVAIARALANQPPILLADEPTGNLDSTTGASVMALLRQLNADGITLVVVTHDPAVAAYADRIVHLRDGQITEITARTPAPAAAQEDRR
ncbi:MAG TPA: ABC transporter ATP-binding protein [Chloroflexia bacterium]|nr:ABC transporter ATP-binding protein [Chloroflexia bacterium]